MDFKPELLSPAGDFDALVAAIQNGADAVYLGGKCLNARRGAGNFDREGLIRAAEYVHERGKKLHVTVNTMVKQSELSQLHEIAEDIAAAGADAAIVQDFGVAQTLNTLLPSLPLHASTQMAICNYQGAAELKNRGFSRVVLAREMSAEDIARCSATGIETEVFCHGALCVACSGLCLFSSLVGGRSGNRGACAQPCRLNYTLSGGACASGYLLSPKDLMTADELERLISAGVSSLKIEGRLKRPEYVAVVTKVYRRVLDGEKFTQNELDELTQIFSRGGFTRGYAGGIRDGEFLSKLRPSHWGLKVGTADTPKTLRLTRDVIETDALVIRGKDETPLKAEGFAGRTLKNPTGKTGDIYRMVSAEQVQKAKDSCRGENILIPLRAKLVLETGKAACAEVTDGTDTVVISGGLIEKSLKSPADPDRIKAQFSKTGGTPYMIDSISAEISPDAFVPVSEINALRRGCLEQIASRRIARGRGCAQELIVPEASGASDCDAMRQGTVPTVTVQSPDIGLLRTLKNEPGIEPVYYPRDLRSVPDVSGMYVYLPAVATGTALDKLNADLRGQSGVKGVYISNFSQLNLDWPGEIRFGSELNIANEPARKYLNIGSHVYMPSVELTSKEINALGGTKEIVVYGRLTLMRLRHCPLNAARSGGMHTACRACDKAACGKRLDDCAFTDRMKAVFPLARVASDEGCVIELLNSVPVSLAGHISKLPAAAYYKLIFTDEDSKTARAITKAYVALANGDTADLSSIPKNITTGHYFRGVE